MKLKEYCESKRISLAALGREIGIGRAQMARYAAGRLPKPDDIRRIAIATSGHVMPNDFYDLDGVPDASLPLSLLVVPTHLLRDFMPSDGQGEKAA